LGQRLCLEIGVERYEGLRLTFQYVPEAIPIGVATVLSGALAIFGWQRRKMPMAPAFATMMAGETGWALGATLEPIIAELPLKRLCIDLRILGTVIAILGLLAFVLRYNGLSRAGMRLWFGAACAPALPLILLVWTDPWHHLYFARLSNERINGCLIAIRTFGPGFWAMFAYGYAVVAVSAILLAKSVIRLTGSYRVQAALMLFGVLLPWAVDIMDMKRIWGFVPVDLVSTAFVVTGLTFAHALYWFRLLDVTPLAWATVVELMKDAVVVIDPSGRIVVLNPAARRIVGRPAREVLGVEATRVFGDWTAIASRLKEIGDPREESFETVHSGPDAVSVFNVSISRLGDGDALAGWLLVLRDISELKRAEQDRETMIWERAARAEAEAANQATDRFLATLSHELRTPLTPVLATATAMLDDPSTPPSFRSVLEMIRRNVDLEARLIDDVLDVTRIKQGQLHLKREIIDAHEQIDGVLEICGDDAHNADLTIISQLRAEAHHIDADPTRFQQVLWNLLKNAIKFTPVGGTVTIRSRNRVDPGPETAAPWLVIEVIDQGIGIEPDVLPRLFNYFVQGSQSTGRKFGGLGLGLAISRSIVEQHGGRLKAASEGKGKGTTLTFELPVVPKPLARTATQVPAPAVIRRKRPLRILLVEDNSDTLRYLSMMLINRGYFVRTAKNLASALRAVCETEFELLISDIDLPDGSGLELMWRLRSESATIGIALSGFGSSWDIEQSRSAGFAEHLTKPVDFRRLLETIQQVMANSGVEGLAKSR
jgi:PAS domain S-box-containing protein